MLSLLKLRLEGVIRVPVTVLECPTNAAVVIFIAVVVLVDRATALDSDFKVVLALVIGCAVTTVMVPVDVVLVVGGSHIC